jgi:uncharacterized protein YjbK
VQINFYYDTPDFKYRTSGVTVRIRQKESGKWLQTKQKNYYGENKNRETSQEVDSIPKQLEFDGDVLYLMGELITDRTRYVLKSGIHVDLDINFYCGITDYELEIELPESGADGNAMSEIEQLVSGMARSECGKITRFFRERLRGR